jgi:hypothetical protein
VFWQNSYIEHSVTAPPDLSDHRARPDLLVSPASQARTAVRAKRETTAPQDRKDPRAKKVLWGTPDRQDLRAKKDSQDLQDVLVQKETRFVGPFTQNIILSNNII